MPAFYIPARDSRHRIACFALYRALLRQVPRIPLPNELSARKGWINPIKYLIRSGFRRNRADTSPRLVHAALQSGYKFLSLLTLAQSTASHEYSSVVDFLQKRQEQFPPPRPDHLAINRAAFTKLKTRNLQSELLARGLSKWGPKPELAKRLIEYETQNKEKDDKGEAPDPFQVLKDAMKPNNRKLGFVPMLTKVNDGLRPVYAPNARPRPLAELSGGERKIPVLEHGRGVPFLRTRKPESLWLGNYIRLKSNRRQKRITLLLELEDDALHEAKLEDKWEGLVRGLAAREGSELFLEDEQRPNVEPRGSNEAHYVRSVIESQQYVREKLNAENLDMVGKAKAMVEIVAEEERLAKEEKEAKNKLREEEQHRLEEEMREMLEIQTKMMEAEVDADEEAEQSETGADRVKTDTIQIEA